jgi:hypothetical protein
VENAKSVILYAGCPSILGVCSRRESYMNRFDPDRKRQEM